MPGRTIVEKVLSAHAGRAARAGDIVICDVDLVVGTDGSGPMAIGYYEQMKEERRKKQEKDDGNGGIAHPERVYFSLDHYEPANTPATAPFHARIRAFAAEHRVNVIDVGVGISHQVLAERAIARPGNLVVGADSHTVTLGALNCVAVGVGSSDLAAAMLTGQIWLRVPETIRITLRGARTGVVAAKDVALAIVGGVRADGADYRAIEFAGDGLASLDVDDRLAIASLMVEAGAKTAVFPFDSQTAAYLARRGAGAEGTIAADADAVYERELTIDLGTLTPRIAMPHAPDNVVALAQAAGTPVQMVFVGTCTGGRASDVRAMRAAFDSAGGRVAPGVQLVITPASRAELDELDADGTIAHLAGAGATVTTPGCGACCGTSGVIPGDGMTVLSTANRNFKGRMGNATASIYLASPAACGYAAATGQIPRFSRSRAAGEAP